MLKKIIDKKQFFIKKSLNFLPNEKQTIKNEVNIKKNIIKKAVKKEPIIYINKSFNLGKNKGKGPFCELYYKYGDHRSMATLFYMIKFKKPLLKFKNGEQRQKLPKTKKQKFQKYKKNLRKRLISKGYILKPLLKIPKLKPFSRKGKKLYCSWIRGRKPLIRIKKTNSKIFGRIVEILPRTLINCDPTFSLSWHFKSNLCFLLSFIR